MDGDAVIAEVAGAAGPAEGPAGVAGVLRVIVRREPVAARQIGRRAGLPVPVVVAVCNELRKRGVVDRGRPECGGTVLRPLALSAGQRADRR